MSWLLSTNSINPPANPNVGDVWYNRATQQIYVWQGSWTEVSINYFSTPTKKLQLSGSRIYGGITFHTVVVEGYPIDQLVEWCNQTFGPSNYMALDTVQNIWFMTADTFYFEQPEQLEWFMLRWSATD